MPYYRGTRYPLLYAPPIVVASGSYIDTVLATSPIAYWPSNETSGTTADNAEGTAARDGTFNAVSLNNDSTGPFGTGAPLFDGTSSYVNTYSSSLDSAFNGQLVTCAVWAKLNTSGSNKRLFRVSADANNNIIIVLESTNINFFYRAGGTVNATGLTAHGITATNWHHFALTASKSSDEVKFYIDGSQFSTTLTGLGTWAGSLSSTLVTIGSNDTSPTQVFNGWIAHMGIWASALSGSTINTLANP